MIITIILLSGCMDAIIPSPTPDLPNGNDITPTYFYNLNDFVIPDDAEFIATIESITTPKEIVRFMKNNFKWVFASWWCYNPYQMWWANTKTGDCNDMSNFAVWAAHYHGYEVYQVHVYYEGEFVSHFLGVFVENGKLNYSSNLKYHPIQATSFKSIAESNCIIFRKKLRKYKVYDYNMNIIERG